MGVQNFLADEDYDDEYEESAPFGAGFSDVITGSSNLFSPSSSNRFNSDDEEEDGGFVPNFLDDEDYDEPVDEEEDFEEDGEVFEGFDDEVEESSAPVAPVTVARQVPQPVEDSPRVVGNERQSLVSSPAPKAPSPQVTSNAARGVSEAVRTVPTGSASSANSSVTPVASASNGSNVEKPKKRRDLSSGYPRKNTPVVTPESAPVERTSTQATPPVVTKTVPSEPVAPVRTPVARPVPVQEKAVERDSIADREPRSVIPNFLEEEDYDEEVPSTPVVKPSAQVVDAPKSFGSPAVVTPVVSVPVPTESESIAVEKLQSPSRPDPKKFTALDQSASMTRTVGPDGLTKSERARASRAAESSQRTPSNGKLSEKEFEFFANLGMDGVPAAKHTVKELLLPQKFEGKKERLERERRIATALGSFESSRVRLTERDKKIIEFIALFKFASQRHIAKLLQVKEHSAYVALNRLKKFGLVKGFKVIGIEGFVWSVTETGMLLSGYDLPRGSKAELNLSMIAHQFTVIHLGAHLWSSGVNVLRENKWPVMNRLNVDGEPVYGDQLVTELQIQSAFGKVRGNNKAAAYVPQIKKHMSNQFDSWNRAGGVEFGPSPEFQAGNEFMWTLFPPVSNKLNYHVPDLVVARPRAADGSPQSIAIEVELRTKSNEESYVKTLEAYRTDANIFKKVVWVCRLKGTAEKIKRIASKNGLIKSGKLTIVPIMEEDNRMLKGRETWAL